MAVITALKMQKHSTERVNVFLDGEFAFGLPVTAAASLHVNQVLSEEEIQKLRWQGTFSLALDRAVRFLGYRPRSQREVTDHLRRHKVDDALIEAVLARLRDLHYVDDLAFAKFWVDNRVRFRPKGARALRYELRQKGVADELIAVALADLSEEDNAYRVIEKKVRQWRTQPDKVFKQKVYAYLSRRGFRYEVIKNVLTRLQTPEDFEEDETVSGDD